MTRKTMLAAIIAGAAFAAPVAQRADAYDLKPMVIQLKPSGNGSSATAVITNTHEVPVAIEIRAYRREQQPDGSDKLTPEDSDVILTPPQMVIQPKASQSFSVQWVGDPKPQRELSYRIVTEQLPIQFTKVTRNDRTADITMKYRYEMALYIEPEGTKPAARIVSAEPVAGEGGVKEVALRIRSEGGMRAILDQPVVELTGGGASVRLEGQAVAALQGLNILPGAERVVRIAAPAGLSAGPVTGTLSTQYAVLK